jgi:tRNA A-37 threonylcarbamoyl transferase component Bud32
LKKELGKIVDRGVIVKFCVYMKIIMDPADEFESITIHDAIRHVGVEETMKTSNNHKKLFMNSDEDFNTFSESAAAAALFTKSLSPSRLSAQQQQQQQQQHSKQEENEINMLKDELNNEVKNSNIDVTINNNYYDNANAAVTISADSSNSIFDMKSQRYVTPQDFDLLKVIGMGAFGKVLQVKNKQTKKVLAMKVISKRLLRHKTSYIENVQAEREILNKVNHPFIVTMHCSFQTREKLFIIMDFLAGGELFLKLGREGIFTENTAAFYISEIVLALEHLHSKGILHRDLKPENILLSSDGHLCLTDFGLAKDFQWDDGEIKEDGKALTVCGTQEYMAPEMVARKGYGKAADWWSLGRT